MTPREKYQQYLHSDNWINFRTEHFHYGKTLCYICGNKAVDLHHTTYDFLGYEKYLVHVFPVCRGCHRKANFYWYFWKIPTWGNHLRKRFLNLRGWYKVWHLDISGVIYLLQAYNTKLDY